MQSNTRERWNNLALYMGVLYLSCTTIRIELGLVSINIVCIQACPGKKQLLRFDASSERGFRTLLAESDRALT
jgi:hypothetical protein